MSCHVNFSKAVVLGDCNDSYAFFFLKASLMWAWESSISRLAFPLAFF